MKKKSFTFAIMPSSGHRMRTFSVSSVGLTVLVLSFAVIITSAILFGSLATWKYCKEQREKADEAVQNAEILQEELENELVRIKKSYSNFKKAMDIDLETEADADTDNNMGKGGPKMPELTDISMFDLYSASDGMNGVEIPSVLLESVSMRSDLNKLTILIDEKMEELATTPSIWPIKYEPKEDIWISSGFRRRRSPFTGKWEMHTGIDVPGPSRTPIVATADGTISKIGSDAYLGNYIGIQHSEKFSTLYGHMRSFAKDIKKGTEVKRGDIIGYMGRTGRATGNHVHYEVRIDGKPVNPFNYILE